MYCIEESTCDTAATFWRLPVIRRSGHCGPFAPGHYAHYGRPQEFFQGGATSVFRLSFSGCRRFNANERSQNALPFSTPPRKCPILRQQSQKLGFFNVAMLHFTQYETTCPIAIGSHCLAALLAKDAYIPYSHVEKRLSQLEVNL